MRTSKTASTLVAAAVVGGGAGAAVDRYRRRRHQHHDGHERRAPGRRAAGVGQPDTRSTSRQVYEGAEDSVAFITAEGDPAGLGTVRRSQSGTATGSGFVISNDGYIVTNAHVVEGASSVKVKVGDGDTQTAQVIGKDTSTDLALLKVDPGVAAHSTPSRSRTPATSTWATPPIAIGNPYGLERTLTTGVVSALDARSARRTASRSTT